ncbi:MAG: Uma2 family endonuclease [Planctomycetota bacterium]|nr:Uma2 family endonuclease [Planctomycetota bacterium]
MSTVLDAPHDRTAEPTLADLSQRFGPMPSWRIRTTPPPGTATEADLLRIYDGESRLCELVDGILVEKDVGYEESVIAGRLLTALNNFVVSRKLGLVTGEAGMMAIAPRLVRIPDVAFVSRKRLPDGKIPTQPIPRLVPNLAVEVISRGNTDEEMRTKLDEYFQAGVELVWLIHPRLRTVDVFTSRESSVTLKESQTLTGGDILPGFCVEIRTLFAGLDD